MRKEEKKDTRSCSGPGSSNCCKPTECQATRIGLLRLDHWKLAIHFRAAWTCWRFVSDSVPPLFWIQKRFLQDACVRAAFKTRGKTRRTAWLRMAMNQLASMKPCISRETLPTVHYQLLREWNAINSTSIWMTGISISCISHGRNGYKIQAPEILLRSHHIASKRLAVLFWKSCSVDDTQPKEHSVFRTWHCPSHPWHEWTSAMLSPQTNGAKWNPPNQ